MTAQQVREAQNSGLRIKEMKPGQAVLRLKDEVAYCYSIMNRKVAEPEVLVSTATMVYRQMAISYNMTMAEVRLACENKIYNSEKSFTCSAADIIQALREYRRSDAFVSNEMTRKKEEQEHSDRDRAVACVNGIRFRMECLRTGRTARTVARLGADMYDYLVKLGKMPDCWTDYEVEATDHTKAFIDKDGNMWTTDVTINAKELAIESFLKRKSDEIYGFAEYDDAETKTNGEKNA